MAEFSSGLGNPVAQIGKWVEAIGGGGGMICKWNRFDVLLVGES